MDTVGLLRDLLHWALYRFSGFDTFVNGYAAVEQIFSLLLEAASGIFDDPTGKLRALIDDLLAELSAARNLWRQGKYHESGLAFGNLLWDLLSMLRVTNPATALAKLPGKLSPRIAKAVGESKSGKAGSGADATKTRESATPDNRSLDAIPEHTIYTNLPNLRVLLRHEPRETYRCISAGHASFKHLHEFKSLKILDPADLLEHVSDVMRNPTHWQKLKNDRIAFWDDHTKTLVVYDPRERDLGTVFRPETGKQHFYDLE